MLLFAHSINTLADDKRIDMNEKNIREKFGAVLLLGISAAVAATAIGTTMHLSPITTHAQQPATTGNNVTTTASSTTLANITTYTAAGSIRSIIVPDQDPDTPYLTFGYWNSTVDNGNLTNFYSNFTMARVNGSEIHNHQIINFRSDNSVSLGGGPLGTTTIFSGTSDVQTNGQPKWNNVSTSIIVDKFNTISVALDSKETDNHFNGQSITGVVESVKDPEGIELLLINLDGIPTVVLPTQNQANQTAGIMMGQ